jgi:phage shock protein A
MSRRHLLKSHLGVLCLVAALAGCSYSEANHVRAQTRIISSSSNSAYMALNAWHLNEVPDAFVQQTLQSMQRDIGNAASEIETLRYIDSKERERLSRLIADIDKLLSQATQQVTHGDHGTVQTAERLKDAAHRLSWTSTTRSSA